MTANTDAHPAGQAGGRGGHNWHDVEYVRQWVAENEARAEARQAQFDLIADYIPYPREEAISILDVGAGWGPVTRHLLTRFPAARATLLDYSDEMYAEARPRLAAYGDRVRFVLGDLASPGAIEGALTAAGGRFDAIVSSSCIHNVRPTERIVELYRELCAATAPGGGFLNLDMVGSGPGLLQAVSHRARIEQIRRRRLAETGTLPSAAEVEAALAARRQEHAPPAGAGGPQPDARTSGGVTRTLFDHLTWLRDAGFDAVECFWRQENRALIAGYRHP
jgi:ubiquinone/menaquinone biosynthesis C-methylase UbiE